MIKKQLSKFSLIGLLFLTSCSKHIEGTLFNYPSSVSVNFNNHKMLRHYSDSTTKAVFLDSNQISSRVITAEKNSKGTSSRDTVSKRFEGNFVINP